VPEAADPPLAGAPLTVGPEAPAPPRWFRVSLEPDGTLERAFWYLALLLAFLVTVARTADPRRAGAYRAVLVGFFGILAAVAIANYLTARTSILWLRQAPDATRPMGPYVNPSHFAGVMELAVPWMLGYGLAPFAAGACASPSIPRGSRRFAVRSSGLQLRVARADRGAVIGLASLVVLAIAARRGRNGRKLLLGGLGVAIVLGAIAFAGPLGGRITDFVAVSQGEVTGTDRTMIRSVGLAIAGDYPLTGVGFGAFRQVVPRYLPPGESGHWMQLHNDYLELLVSGGIVAAVLAAWLSIAYAVRLTRSVKVDVRAGHALPTVGLALGWRPRRARARRFQPADSGQRAPVRRDRRVRPRASGANGRSTMKRIHVVHVVGARPNFIKIAPILAACSRRPELRSTLVHTGQHYDEAMSKLFFDELRIPRPDVNLEVGSGSHAAQTAAVLQRFEPILLEQRPDLVVVGDVNSTLACSLAAVKLGIAVAHVEAGLRSFDRTMPEEINRVVTDAISDLLFITESSAASNLAREGIDPGRVRFVGNVMIDTLLAHRDAAARSGVIDRLGLAGGAYAVLTLHRPATVDEPAVLHRILSPLADLAVRMPVVFPVHPRTRTLWRPRGAAQVGRRSPRRPARLPGFRPTHERCEARSHRQRRHSEKPPSWGSCVTIRGNTERPITLTHGTNRLAGTTSKGSQRDRGRAGAREGVRAAATLGRPSGGTDREILSAWGRALVSRQEPSRPAAMQPFSPCARRSACRRQLVRSRRAARRSRPARKRSGVSTRGGRARTGPRRLVVGETRLGLWDALPARDVENPGAIRAA
jgi:UDP-N-acetylglucosamine 2-epimerase (non-hydrolysing)